MALSISIKITYFLQISISFNKSLDLFWDRWSHPHNSHKLNGLQSGHRWDLMGFVVFKTAVFEILLGTPLESTQIHFRARFGITPTISHLADPGICSKSLHEILFIFAHFLYERAPASTRRVFREHVIHLVWRLR